MQDSLLLHSWGTHWQHGVALVASPRLVNNDWLPISDRYLQSRFSHKHDHLTVPVAYAPAGVADDGTKDLFYHKISATIVIAPLQHCNLDDLSAVTGPPTPTDSNSIVGPFGSGIRDDNTERLLSLCVVHGLTVMEAWFRRRVIHRWIWLSHDGITNKAMRR